MSMGATAFETGAFWVGIFLGGTEDIDNSGSFDALLKVVLTFRVLFLV